jgi:hypothetical protein
MIQFNLLPDIKLEYIKAKRTKHSVMVIAILVAGGAAAIFVLLFLTVNVLQKQHINNLTNDIKQDSAKLESTEDIDRILTVQNQLNKLTELLESKPVLSRLKQYIDQITPSQVNYALINIDLATNSMTINGSTDSLRSVNQFVDTLKFTKYKTEGSSEEINAFSAVVLTGFSKGQDGSTSYNISFTFDPAIFSSKTAVELVVPNITTTRSAIQKPSTDLLQPLSLPEEAQ